MVAAIGFKEVLWSLSICFLLALAAKIFFASLFVLKDARDKAGVWNAEVESLNDEQIRSGGVEERWRAAIGVSVLLEPCQHHQPTLSSKSHLSLALPFPLSGRCEKVPALVFS